MQLTFGSGYASTSSTAINVVALNKNTGLRSDSSTQVIQSCAKLHISNPTTVSTICLGIIVDVATALQVSTLFTLPVRQPWLGPTQMHGPLALLQACIAPARSVPFPRTWWTTTRIITTRRHPDASVSDFPASSLWPLWERWLKPLSRAT